MNQPNQRRDARLSRIVRVSCLRKVRHKSRAAAEDAMASTLGNRLELLVPYRRKICSGWHVGHPRVDRLRDYEPHCVCGHVAMTHEVAEGMGCHECHCTDHREWVYRRAIAEESKRWADELRKRRRLGQVLRAVILSLPAELSKHMSRSLARRFRGKTFH